MTTTRVNSAPKGRNRTAQGNALGTESLVRPVALKGRDRSSTQRGCRPFRAEARRPGKAVLRRPAFSLLEVILALTILAGAVAVLGEVARQGLETARIARDLTYAQFICDSLMAEITSGIIYPESVDQVPVDEVCDPSRMGWLYSIDLESTEIEGLVAVRVTVSQPLPEEKHPVRCSLVRWMEDPDLVLSSSSSTQ